MKKAFIIQFLIIMLGGFLLIPASAALAVEPLTIDEIKVDMSDTTATITWRTNRAATGQVDYGLASTSYHFRVSTNVKKQDQAITLFGLYPETTYYFRIKAQDDLAEVYSFEKTFKSEKFSDSETPTISKVNVAYVSASTATIQWETDELSTTEVEYGLTQNYGSNAANGTLVRTHDITIRNLQPSLTYQFLVKSKDKDNNIARWYNLNFRTLDSTNSERDDLIIYDVRPTSQNDALVSKDSAVISWRTNKLAEGKIRYGTTTNLGKTVDANPPRDFMKSVTLTGLAAGTTYYYEVEAKDVFGKTIKSTGHSFQTKGNGGTLPVDTQVLGASTEGLIVYLPFSEGVGSVTQDQSFNDNDGQLSASNPPSWSTGKFGNGVRFSSRGQNVAISDNAMLSLRSGVTMLAWINIDNFGSYDKIITKQNAYEILLGDHEGVLRMAIFPDNGKDWKWLNTPNNPLKRGAWQLVAGTFDGDYMRLYVDGVQVAEVKNTMVINDTSHPIYLGGNVVNNKEFFEGSLDDVAIFNYALSASEIETIYNNGVGSYLSDTGIPTQGNGGASGGDDSGRVLGSSNEDTTSRSTAYACNPDLGYTKIKALYKTSDSPDVWAILETGQKHYITSPASFNLYQCNWSAIKTVSRATLNSYPSAQLVRTIGNPTVYHLYQRPQSKWLKLNIPSPTVFVSYPENFWGNVARINDLDMAAYPDAKLIKAANDAHVYLIEGSNKRHIASEAVFNRMQFEWFEVVTVNSIHLESYQTIEPLQ